MCLSTTTLPGAKEGAGLPVWVISMEQLSFDRCKAAAEADVVTLFAHMFLWMGFNEEIQRHGCVLVQDLNYMGLLDAHGLIRPRTKALLDRLTPSAVRAREDDSAASAK